MSEQTVEQGGKAPEVLEQGAAGCDVHEPRAATLSGELPCGHLDAAGTVHSSYVVNEMTGTEEDLLAGKGPVIPRLNRVIGNCLVSLGAITARADLQAAASALTSMDRMVLLIALRRASLGDAYDMKIACPACHKVAAFAVDLSGLAITPMPDRAVRVFTEPLPSGRVATWHVMGVVDEEWAARKRRGNEDDLLTLALLARVSQVGAVALDREGGWAAARAALKALPARDREALRRAFDAREGGVDDEVAFACEGCGHEWTAQLDVAQPGFFFPSAASGH
jgi:hypothetical protein